MAQAIRIRKSQKLSSGMQCELARYALAAGAAGVSILALGSPANAEVIYTEVNQTIDRHQGFAIDLNDDGIVDFRIQNLFRVITAGGFPYIKTFALQARPGRRVQVGRNGRTEAALLSGENIGPIQPAAEGAVMEWQVGESGLGSYYSGSWLNVANRYLGLAFKIDGETHFGWARLSVRWNHGWAISADITGYAYETVPNKPIIAGDTGSARDEDADSQATSEMFSARQGQPEPATLGSLARYARAWARAALEAKSQVLRGNRKERYATIHRTISNGGITVKGAARRIVRLCYCRWRDRRRIARGLSTRFGSNCVYARPFGTQS